MAPFVVHVSLVVVGILVFLGSGGLCYTSYNMEEEELFAVFEVMGSLLEDPTWPETHPLPCTDTPWPGLECGLIEETLTFHVVKIHVGDDVVMPPCKSSARISDALLKLPYLSTLSLVGCFTHSPVSLSDHPRLFRSLSSLEHLTLHSNPSLSGEIPSSISHLSSLKSLSLSQNNLTGLIPTEIGRLLNLQQLDLSHNNFIGPIPHEIGFLQNLTILDLSWNSLQQTLPASLGDLTSLQKIDFSSNKLRGAPPPELGKLRRLVLLDLSHNYITGPIPESLSGLGQLQYLIMEGNPLNSRIPSFAKSLTNLSVLTLSGCGLYGPIPSILSNLINLTALSLDNNSLEGTVPPEIGALQNLDTLNLSGNHLSGQLVFPQEFMNRIGQRLDIRENNGLCTNPALGTRNTSSRFLQNPTCLSATAIFPAATNKTVADKKPDPVEDLKPNLYGGSAGSDHLNSDSKFLIFSGLVLMFLLD